MHILPSSIGFNPIINLPLKTSGFPSSAGSTCQQKTKFLHYVLYLYIHTIYIKYNYSASSNLLNTGTWN